MGSTKSYKKGGTFYVDDGDLGQEGLLGTTLEECLTGRSPVHTDRDT